VTHLSPSNPPWPSVSATPPFGETKIRAEWVAKAVPRPRSWKKAQGEYESRTFWHRAVAWNRLAAFAATLKKGQHVQLVGELRTREYEKEYGNRKKFTVKQRVCEIALQSILKLDRAERQEEPAPDVHPTELPAEQPTVPSEDVPS